MFTRAKKNKQAKNTLFEDSGYQPQTQLPSDLEILATNSTIKKKSTEETPLSQQTAAFFKPPQKTILEKVLSCFCYKSTNLKI